MDRKSKKLTLMKIVKEKPIPFILLTLILTKGFNIAADHGLTYLLNLNNDHPLYTYNYSLGKFGIILSIPAALLSIWIIKLFIKDQNSSSQSLNVNAENEKRSYVPQKQDIKKSKAYPVQENRLYIQLKNIFIKIIKMSLKILFWFLIFTFKFTTNILKFFSKNIAHSVDNTMSGWISNFGSILDSDYERKTVKNAANWNARQKQKEANYAWNQAAKQANYNQNTIYFEEKLNRAERIQREANEAKRNARKL